MKITAILKLRSRLQCRRDKAQNNYFRDYFKPHYDPLALPRVRLKSEVITLDQVLFDLDRLIARNHDRFCARRVK